MRKTVLTAVLGVLLLPAAACQLATTAPYDYDSVAAGDPVPADPVQGTIPGDQVQGKNFLFQMRQAIRDLTQTTQVGATVAGFSYQEGNTLTEAPHTAHPAMDTFVNRFLAAAPGDTFTTLSTGTAPAVDKTFTWTHGGVTEVVHVKKL